MILHPKMADPKPTEYKAVIAMFVIGIILVLTTVALTFALPNPPGPEGPKGPSGINGVGTIFGPTGAIGPQGAQGGNGPVGINGVSALTGPTGPQGDAGPSGFSGQTGATGSTGTQGNVGVPGAAAAAPKWYVSTLTPEPLQGLTNQGTVYAIEDPLNENSPSEKKPMAYDAWVVQRFPIPAAWNVVSVFMTVTLKGSGGGTRTLFPGETNADLAGGDTYDWTTAVYYSAIVTTSTGRFLELTFPFHYKYGTTLWGNYSLNTLGRNNVNNARTLVTPFFGFEEYPSIFYPAEMPQTGDIIQMSSTNKVKICYTL
jgi:hypothetical protein